MMSLWDALRMNMMISYQELVRTFPSLNEAGNAGDGEMRKVCYEIRKRMKYVSPSILYGGARDYKNIPPETSTRWAFIQRNSSLSSAAMASPISSGSPTLPSAVCAAIC